MIRFSNITRLYLRDLWACPISDRIETNNSSLVCIPLNGQYVELERDSLVTSPNVTDILLLFVRSLIVTNIPHNC